MSIEVDKACLRLTSQMRPPQGYTKADLTLGYASSLEGVPSDVVVRVIDRFLKGGYDPNEINPRFAPAPPELAVLCRKAVPKDRERVIGRLYAFRRPTSSVLEANIKRDEAKMLVDNGMYPRGSIWCPHDLESKDWGALYNPDPGWGGPERLKTKDEARAAEEAEEEERKNSKGFAISEDERQRAGFHFAGRFMDLRANDRAAFFARLPNAEIERWVSARRAARSEA